MADKKQGESAFQDADKDDVVPDYLWTEVYSLGSNSCDIESAAKTQNRVLNSLLPRRKNEYSLPEWYSGIKELEQEDLLYSLCGLVHPVEAEMIHHYVNRWQQGLIQEKMEGFSFDDEEDVSQRKIVVPRATFKNFMRDSNCAVFMLENHENLLLRLDAVKGIVNRLDEALYLESVRQKKEEWRSAVDELVGQYAFPKNASDPDNEFACWLWMNKMVAPTNDNLWHLNLNATREVVGAFNWFKIHKCFADLLDYAKNPICTQRVDGKLQKETEVPWMSAKILMTTNFLLKRGFLDRDELISIGEMAPRKRVVQEKRMKRAVVSSFLSDISKSAPDNETFGKMLSGFERYFRPILRETGSPTLEKIMIEHKNKKGKTKLGGVIKVAFYNSKSAFDQLALKSKKNPQDPPKTKTINRPESGLSK